MRRSISGAVSIILMLAGLLAVSVSCSPDAADIQETATLSVSISSSDNGKTIAPDDPDIGITHFRITISDGLGVNSVSDYIPAGSSFIVSDLRIGQWTISAEGYAYVDSSYVLVAEGSTPVTLTAGENSVSVKLEPVDAAAGDVTVSLLLPSSFGDGSFSYWFWITDIDGNPVTISQETGSSSSPLTGTAADGVGSFTISGMKQGGYLLYATVRDGDGKEYSAVEAMRLIAGMPASGVVEFPDTNLSVFFDFELNPDGKTYTVTGLKEGMTQPDPDVFEIPSQYKGKPVTTIGNSAFNAFSSGRKDMVGTVVIPDSVTSIGSNAFSGCSGLTSVDIPDSVTTIKDGAFSSCSGLMNITIPKSVKSIEDYTFNNCSGLTSIDIPDSVTEIGSSAFAWCQGLTSISIPDSVTKTTSLLFDNCSLLSDIYCEAPTQPEGWHPSWLGKCNADVFWGVSRDDYDSIVAGTFNVAEPVISVSDTNEVTISSDTSFAHIYYTTDGSNPTAENGTLYDSPFTVEEGTTVKTVAYVGMDTYSDIALFEELPEPEIGTVLSDGSVVFYDRGEKYGNYGIKDGDIVRLSEGVDDGSATSANWRYLICDKSDFIAFDGNVKVWGDVGVTDKVKDSEIGAGLPNTLKMESLYASRTGNWWYPTFLRAIETGFDWFVPSKDELELLYRNKDIIVNAGGEDFSPSSEYYWSSTEYDDEEAWCMCFGPDHLTTQYKATSYRCRLIRRI